MTRMISTQKLNIFCLITVLLGTCGNAQSGCGYGGWIPYKDEKCILVLDTVVNAEEAASICSSQSPSESSNLLSIKTKEEQLFVTQQLYEVSGVVDNVWVDARRSGTSSTFIWTDDNSPVRYSNWAPGFPSSDTRKGCVQMISHVARDGSRMAEGGGLWQDISCLRRNLVVCQKLQTLSSGELQRMILALRRRVRGNEEKYDRKIQEIENNPVPLGFIYLQLSGQPEPKEIWPKVQFTDVTSTYAGQFFRALGGDSGEFGSTQNFSSPVLSVTYNYMTKGYVGSATVPIGSWSPYVMTGPEKVGGTFHGFYTLGFMFEDTEVRPYNSAVKIWKRTA